MRQQQSTNRGFLQIQLPPKNKPNHFRDFATLIREPTVVPRRNTVIGTTYEDQNNYLAFQNKSCNKKEGVSKVLIQNNNDKEIKRKSVWNQVGVFIPQNQNNPILGNYFSHNNNKKVNYFPQKSRQKQKSSFINNITIQKNEAQSLVFRAKSDTNILNLRNLAKLYQEEIYVNNLSNNNIKQKNKSTEGDQKRKDVLSLLLQQTGHHKNNQGKSCSKEVGQTKQKRRKIPNQENLYQQNIRYKKNDKERYQILEYMQLQQLKSQKSNLIDEQILDRTNKDNFDSKFQCLRKKIYRFMQEQGIAITEHQVQKLNEIIVEEFKDIKNDFSNIIAVSQKAESSFFGQTTKIGAGKDPLSKITKDQTLENEIETFKKKLEIKDASSSSIEIEGGPLNFELSALQSEKLITKIPQANFKKINHIKIENYDEQKQYHDDNQFRLIGTPSIQLDQFSWMQKKKEDQPSSQMQLNLSLSSNGK